MSIRRACSVLEFDRSNYHYKPRRREQAGLEARIKEICATRVRYGYRRVHVLLCGEGWKINLKKTHRIYNELGLQPPEMRRLKQLEDENAKLKKIVADLSLDREMLQDVIRRKL